MRRETEVEQRVFYANTDKTKKNQKKNQKKSKILDLYAEHKKYAYAEACRILADKAEAEDAVQETYIKIMDNIDKFNDISTLQARTLIVIICRNTALNMRRGRGKEIPLPRDDDYDCMDSVCESAENTAIRRETFNELVALIKSLPENYRDPFLMRHAFGFSNKDIAAALGISEDLARQRVSRAKKKILKMLEEDPNGKRFL